MPLISAKTILTSLSLFHITLGFFFLTNPGTIADQALVWLVGEAMGMPPDHSFDTQSAPLAFLAVVLTILGITDLTSLSLPEEVCLLSHWATQAPLRLLVSMILIVYSFVFSPTSPVFGGGARANARTASGMRHPSAHAVSPDYEVSSWGGDGLKNRVFFTFMFVEMISWFWVWVTLKEEKAGLLAKRARRRSASAGYVGRMGE